MADIWSRQNMESYMAVTAHFISKSPTNDLTMETQLVAFRKLDGSHTGINIAQNFIRIMREIDCLNNVSDIVGSVDTCYDLN